MIYISGWREPACALASHAKIVITQQYRLAKLAPYVSVTTLMTASMSALVRGPVGALI
jgi:hypothetical protein